MASITDYARMCRAYDGMCALKKCPISYHYHVNGNCALCGVFLRTQTAEAEAIIDQWCAEHPQKTYMQDFLEKFPNTMMSLDSIPMVCRAHVYGGGYCPYKDKFSCADCSQCWNEVMPEEGDEHGA